MNWVLAGLSVLLSGFGQVQTPSHLSILAFSKSAGYRHDSIPTARRAILDMGMERGWTVSFSEDASVFETSRLRAFDAVVCICTTGNYLNDAQQKALVGFIHHGGGFVGIHAAADAEYSWPWYGQLVGAFFLQHPAIQQASVVVEDPAHPSTSSLPNPWVRKDEWYDYRTNPRSHVHVLATVDTTSYQGTKMPGDHPITWCQDFEGGRSWYTGMGHTTESYQDPVYLKMLAGGIEWACGKSRRQGAR